MALNSFVTRDGLEMGRAQVVQAQAAGIEPDVRMNPILLKPSSDVGSQVIVNGEVRGQMPAAAYFKLKKSLIPDILAAYDSLAKEVDIIVIEGAGSPAEINLKADDIVNMGLAKLVDAPVLLAGDIDRGGVFAQLYGTVELLEPITPEISPTVSTAVTMNMISTGRIARASNTTLTGISLGTANQEACATLLQLSTHALVNSTPSAVTPVVGSTRPIMKATT